MISEIESEYPMESLRAWLRNGNPPEDSSRRRQIRGIAAFFQDPAACQAHPDGDRVVVTPPLAPKDSALLEAEERFRKSSNLRMR